MIIQSYHGTQMLLGTMLQHFDFEANLTSTCIKFEMPNCIFGFLQGPTWLCKNHRRKQVCTQFILQVTLNKMK